MGVELVLGLIWVVVYWLILFCVVFVVFVCYDVFGRLFCVITIVRFGCLV